MTDLASLLQPITEDDEVTTQLAILAAANFPVTTWDVYSVPLNLVKADARTLAALSNWIPEIAAGGYLDLASGAWLTLLAISNYKVARDVPVVCVRTLRVTEDGSGAIDIAVGQLRIATAAGLYFNNSTGGHLSSSSHLDLEWTAEEAGANYNAATAAWNLISGATGIDIGEVSGTPTINTAGADEETDASLRTRCRGKLATQGAGANDDAWKYNVQSVNPSEITQVLLEPNTPSDLWMTITIAGPNGVVAGDIVDAVQAVIDPYPTVGGKRPSGSRATVGSATANTQTLTGTVTVKAAQLAAAQAAAEASIEAYRRLVDIGGNVSWLVVWACIAQSGTTGVVDIVSPSPSADIALGAHEVVAFDLSSITWATV